MDLLDFSDCKLYFEEPIPAEAERLIAQAASEYGEASARLMKLALLDSRDQLGAGKLLELVDKFQVSCDKTEPHSELNLDLA